jgi:tRNA (adenine37-N6)-methyltransferase
MCRIVRVADTQLFVADLDAIDGTAVLDLKPVMSELMREYW